MVASFDYLILRNMWVVVLFTLRACSTKQQLYVTQFIFFSDFKFYRRYDIGFQFYIAFWACTETRKTGILEHPGKSNVGTVEHRGTIFFFFPGNV